MRRGALAVLLAVVALSASAGAEEIPEGVRYVQADREVDARAAALLREGLRSRPLRIARLAAPGAGPLLVGPFLSSALIEQGLADPADFAKATFQVPLADDVKPSMPALAARTDAQRGALDQALSAARLGLPSQVRKLTPAEMTLVWFYVGWDLEEPLFVVEHGSHKLVVDFDTTGSTVTWIEDLGNPCFRVAWEGGGLEPCFCGRVVGSGRKLSVAFETRRDPERECGEVRAAGPEPAGPRPVVHNHVSKATSDLDAQVARLYGDSYQVREIAESDADYVEPRLERSSWPVAALDQEERPITGHVFVAYVVLEDGSAADPRVLRSSDARLEPVVLDVLRGARFRPATWHGQPVSSVAAQEFAFAPTVESNPVRP